MLDKKTKMAQKKRRGVIRTTRKNKRKLFTLPWPASVFLLLCTGVILVSWTLLVSANDIVVKAKVPAPLPTGPAEITSPSGGRHFSAIPITVSGTCSSDGSGAYVKLYRNSVFSGVAQCAVDNTFQLTSDLFAGTNILVADIYNKTDDAGPYSSPLTVYYDAPRPPEVNPTPGNSSTPASTIPQFTLTTDFNYVGYYVGADVKWKLKIVGGLIPYAISTDWGDGNHTLSVQNNAGYFTIEHKYNRAGGGKDNSYIITVSGSDAANQKSQVQLFVLIKQQLGGPVAAATQPPPIGQSGSCSESSPAGPAYASSSLSCFIQNTLNQHKNLLKFLWPTYAVVLLMAISYWLGEREEFLVLGRKGWPRPRRR